MPNSLKSGASRLKETNKLRYQLIYSTVSQQNTGKDGCHLTSAVLQQERTIINHNGQRHKRTQLRQQLKSVWQDVTDHTEITAIDPIGAATVADRDVM